MGAARNRARRAGLIDLMVTAGNPLCYLIAPTALFGPYGRSGSPVAFIAATIAGGRAIAGSPIFCAFSFNKTLNLPHNLYLLRAVRNNKAV
jgi:hypothetical protein